MIWTLDMDDFHGEFCRKNKKQSKRIFPLVNAMKDEFLVDQLTTTIASETTTTTLFNETLIITEYSPNDFEQLFFNSSSLASRVSPQEFLCVYLLTTCYLIRSTIDIISQLK